QGPTRGSSPQFETTTPLRSPPGRGGLMHAVAIVILLLGGHVSDQSRNVGHFTGVQVSAGIQARIETGPDGPITVHAEDEVLPRVRTEIKGTTLFIGFEPNSHIHTQEAVKVSIRMPSANLLGVSGGAEIEGNVVAADALRLDASGGGHIRL